jgi:hypothetical protein
MNTKIVSWSFTDTHFAQEDRNNSDTVDETEFQA